MVHTCVGRNGGLLVEGIVDIGGEHLGVERVGRRHGILGTTVLQGRVTDLLDVVALVNAAHLDLDEPLLAKGA